VVDPVEPAASNVTVNSTNLLINVPGGAAHDAWTGGNNTVRAMQSIANVDFDIEVKFRSMVASQYQFQGLLVEQDSGNYARFDVLQADCQCIVFSTNFVNGNPQTNPIPLNQRIRNGSNFYVRLKRTGNQFTFNYSYDGLRWTTILNQQVYTLNVTKIGVMAGNSAGPSGTASAFTASVDYFVNRLAPPATEDGQPFPPPSVRPVIDVWYGDNQTFGQLGVPQQWINILGNVSSAAGLATLTYTLNGGASK
jgi:regulation of enolase protein 1 (concanavalin A-like superfamily)